MAYLRSSRSILTRESDAIDAAVVNDEPLDNVESEGTLDVTDVIAAEEAEAEVAELNGAIEAENEVIEENQEVAEELEEVAEANETLINEAPEQVTPEQVVAAEQAFVHAIGRARLNRKEMMEIRRSTAVSFESASASPLQALRVTQEGIKDFLRNLWDQIKTLIGKVVGAIQKLFQKVKAAFAGLEKKAAALKASVKNITSVTVSPELTKEFENDYPFFCSFKTADEIVTALKFASFGNIVSKLASNAGSGALTGGLLNFITSLTDNFMSASQVLKDRIAVASAIKGFAQGAEIGDVIVAQKFVSKEDSTYAYPFITDGKVLYVLIVGGSLEETDEENRLSFRFNVVKLDSSDLGDNAAAGGLQLFTSVNTLNQAVNACERGAKELNKVVDGVRKSEEILKKLADNMINKINKSESEDSVLKTDIKIVARTVQLTATKVSLAAVNCYINGIRNLTAMVAKTISENKKSAKDKQDRLDATATGPSV